MGRITLATPPAVTPALAVEPSAPPAAEPPAPAPASASLSPIEQGAEAEAELDTAEAARIAAAVARVDAAHAGVIAAREHVGTRKRELRTPGAELTVAVGELQLAQQRYDDGPTEAGLAALEAARKKHADCESAYRAAERALETARTVLTDCERALGRARDDKRREELRPRISGDSLHRRTRARMVAAVALVAQADAIRRELLRETETFMAERSEARALGLALPTWPTNPQTTDEMIALAVAAMRARDGDSALPPLVLHPQLSDVLERSIGAHAHSIALDGLAAASLRGGNQNMGAE